MDMGNGRIHNCRLGRAANLGKVGKEGSKVLKRETMCGQKSGDRAKYNVGKVSAHKEAPIECLSSLAFNSVVCGTPLSGVGPSRRLTFSLRIS
jgi:hypothetical protein